MAAVWWLVVIATIPIIKSQITCPTSRCCIRTAEKILTNGEYWHYYLSPGYYRSGSHSLNGGEQNLFWARDPEFCAEFRIQGNKLKYTYSWNGFTYRLEWDSDMGKGYGVDSQERNLKADRGGSKGDDWDINQIGNTDTFSLTSIDGKGNLCGLDQDSIWSQDEEWRIYGYHDERFLGENAQVDCQSHRTKQTHEPFIFITHSGAQDEYDTDSAAKYVNVGEDWFDNFVFFPKDTDTQNYMGFVIITSVITSFIVSIVMVIIYCLCFKCCKKCKCEKERDYKIVESVLKDDVETEDENI